MYVAMASCSSSLVLSRGRPFHAPRGREVIPRPGAAVVRSGLGLTRTVLFRRATVTASASETPSDAIVSSSDDGGGPGAQSRRRRGRPRNPETIDHPSSSQGDEEEDEEWDFFGELASHIEHESQRGWTGADETERAEAAHVVAAEVVDPPTLNGNGSIPEASTASVAGRQEGEDAFPRDHASGDADDDVDYDDPRYQQKPDWMQDAVWEAINNQGGEDDEEEGQPLWVEEEDPTWPEEEPEDGWGFKTSQFFNKVSVKSTEGEDNDDDDDDEEEELKMNWESEADDWMIKEITANEWEYSVFADPSPLVVYMFARYGRRGMDSWKMLEQLEKAVTSVWESGKAPLRAVKVDIGMEIDLGSALGISKDECPQLLFIKNGKGLYRLKDQRNAEELMQLLAHFFYNGKRPSFLTSSSTSESLRSVA